MLFCAALASSLFGSKSIGPPGTSAWIARWQTSSWFISSCVIEKKHLRIGSSWCVSNAWIVAFANTAGPEPSKFASTAYQYMIPDDGAAEKASDRSVPQGKPDGSHTCGFTHSHTPAALVARD